MAAAVLLRTERLSVRIDDSKRLTRLQRERACEAILAHADVGFGIATPEEIDRWNIRQAALLAMQRAVQDLPSPPDLALVDGTAAPSLPMPCRTLVRGDQRSYVIGCASIMAKVLRDRLMAFYDRLAPGYAFGQHKGYGTLLHARRLSELGPSVFHRLSFRPVADVMRTSVENGRDVPADAHPTTLVALAQR